MIIGIDCRRINDSGIGTYTAKILEYFGKMQPTHQFILFVSNKEVVPFSLKPHFKYVEIKSKPYGVLDQFQMVRLLKQHHVDVLHVPYPWAPFFWKGKVVITLHDLLPFIYKEATANMIVRVFFQMWIILAIRRADRIVAVSENTETDILRYFSVDPLKIEVIHNGVEVNAFQSMTPETVALVLKKYNITQPYLLFANQWKRYKGAPLLLKAFSQMKKRQRSNLKLVVTGKKIPVITAKDIMTTGYVSYSELMALYRAAAVIIAPSKYEGFGMVYLESIMSGSKLLAFGNKLTEELNIPKEYTFRSFDAKSLADGIISVMEGPCLPIPDLSRFSWDNHTQSLLSLFLKLQ